MRNVFRMPEDLPGLVALENFPGMIPIESRPLRAFLQRHGASFNEVRFNVRLGEGVKLTDDHEPALQKAWELLTKMRVDAMGWNDPNVATLIEAKQSLANDGIWQLLSYRDHYQHENSGHDVRLVAVAEFATPTARALARNSGVALYTYEFPADVPDVRATGTETAPDAP
jgi:hypothetical protein